jgi:hypothetical protein
MNRIDVYTAVHKMQRTRLFALTVAAGRADSTNTVTTAHLAGAIRALSNELTSHAEHEDRFIHPPLRIRVPELAAALDAAHGNSMAALSTSGGRSQPEQPAARTPTLSIGPWPLSPPHTSNTLPWKRAKPSRRAGGIATIRSCSESSHPSRCHALHWKI